MPIIGDRVIVNAPASKYHGISGVVVAVSGGMITVKLDTNEEIRTHYLNLILI